MERAECFAGLVNGIVDKGLSLKVVEQSGSHPAIILAVASLRSCCDRGMRITPEEMRRMIEDVERGNGDLDPTLRTMAGE